MIYTGKFKCQVKDETKNIIVQNSCLIEQLGLVDIVFSDKTGTITENEMIFDSFIGSKFSY